LVRRFTLFQPTKSYGVTSDIFIDGLCQKLEQVNKGDDKTLSGLPTKFVGKVTLSWRPGSLMVLEESGKRLKSKRAAVHVCLQDLVIVPKIKKAVLIDTKMYSALTIGQTLAKLLETITDEDQMLSFTETYGDKNFNTKDCKKFKDSDILYTRPATDDDCEVVFCRVQDARHVDVLEGVSITPVSIDKLTGIHNIKK
jgi:hypothetical protein